VSAGAVGGGLGVPKKSLKDLLGEDDDDLGGRAFPAAPAPAPAVASSTPAAGPAAASSPFSAAAVATPTAAAPSALSQLPTQPSFDEDQASDQDTPMPPAATPPAVTAPTAAAPRAPPAARKSYVVLLMLAEDEAFARALELGVRACDAAVHAQCSQWDGTRHVTLFELKLSDDEAARVDFAKPLSLPLRLSLADSLMPWPNTLGLGLAPASDAALRAALPALRGVPEGATTVLGGKKLHVTLFSMRRVSRDARDAAKVRARSQSRHAPYPRHETHTPPIHHAAPIHPPRACSPTHFTHPPHSFTGAARARACRVARRALRRRRRHAHRAQAQGRALRRRTLSTPRLRRHTLAARRHLRTRARTRASTHASAHHRARSRVRGRARTRG